MTVVIALGAMLTGLTAGGVGAATVDNDARIDRLMEASGLNQSVKQILPGVLSSLDGNQQQPALPPPVRAAMRNAAAQSFQAAPMLEKVRARLAGELTAGQISDTQAWLDTPLGRRITDLENASNEPEAMVKMQAYAEELAKRPAPTSRLRLIRDLILATGAQEMMNQITEAVIMATALGFNAAQPKQQQMPTELLRQQIKSGMPEIQKQTEQFAMSMMLYTYRSLSDTEVDSYIRFSRSASGAAFNKSVVLGMSEALLDAIARFMTAIPGAMERSKGALGT